MIKNYLFLYLIVGIGLVITLSSCQKDPEKSIISIQLDHTVKGENVQIEQLQYLSEAGHTYSVVNLKYYISNIVLHRKDGTIYDDQKDYVHLFDIHQAGTETLTFTDVPNGHYNGLSFIFGLDETVNVNQGLENTIENINMEWPIPGDQGYHYMKFEGRYDSLNTGTIRTYNIHTGAAKGNQNYIRVDLPFASSELSADQFDIRLEMDLHEWLHHPFTFDFVGHEKIMQNQEAQEMIKANGASVFSINSVNKY